MKTLTDLSLIAQVVISHNRRAFDTLVSRHQSQVRRFFLHQTLGDAPLSGTGDVHPCLAQAGDISGTVEFFHMVAAHCTQCAL